MSILKSGWMMVCGGEGSRGGAGVIVIAGIGKGKDEWAVGCGASDPVQKVVGNPELECAGRGRGGGESGRIGSASYVFEDEDEVEDPETLSVSFAEKGMT